MQRTSVPQVSHWNRLPSWFDMMCLRLLLLFHRLAAAVNIAVASLRHDHLSAALIALVTLADLICQRLLLFLVSG
jgi:hypothetical protein